MKHTTPSKPTEYVVGEQRAPIARGNGNAFALFASTAAVGASIYLVASDDDEVLSTKEGQHALRARVRRSAILTS